MSNPDTHIGVPTEDRNESAHTPPALSAKPSARVEVDDSKTTADYANYCRLSGMPEELVIDCGLNSQPTGIPTQPIMLTQRIVTGWYTAKRLLHVLQLTVERHEADFGVIETDVQKRVRRTFS